MLVMALCVPALFSCEIVEQVMGQLGLTQEEDPIANVAYMYNMSTPTKVVATTNHNIGGFKLDCRYELVTGFVDNKPASVYTVSTEEIRSVEEGGANEEVKDIIVSTTKKTETVEGYGARVNGGEWNPDAKPWTIGRGRMAINLDAQYLTNAVYENHTLSFTVSEANVAQVLGEEYSANIVGDVEITIVDDGAVITSIELHYNLKGDEAANLVESEMVVKVVYTYDLEKITLD